MTLLTNRSTMPLTPRLEAPDLIAGEDAGQHLWHHGVAVRRVGKDTKPVFSFPERILKEQVLKAAFPASRLLPKVWIHIPSQAGPNQKELNIGELPFMKQAVSTCLMELGTSHA